MNEHVIRVEGLSVDYRIRGTFYPAIRDIDLQINPLQIHGLVGESGSGKSTLGLTLLRMLASNSRISAGRIDFAEQDLVQATAHDMESVWGRLMALVPQNPMDSLNPSIRIGRQMGEVTQLHFGIDRDEARTIAERALASVRIADPLQILDRYPHELSGGMLQRVMIAMAMSTRPRLIVMDEPTTALDVTTQAVILDLMRDLIKQEEAAALYVSHDLGTVAQLCDYVTVLYAGEVMESAPVDGLFRSPKHPYTIGLLNCLPGTAAAPNSRLAAIGGVAPALSDRPDGCVFCDRCVLATEMCRSKKPPLQETHDGGVVRCWRWEEVASGLSAVRRPEADHEAKESTAETVMGVTGIEKQFGTHPLVDRVLKRPAQIVRAVHDVSLQVGSQTTFGLVGESGSGKTSLARAIVALAEADGGSIELLDRPLSLKLRRRDQQALKNLRMVFQNPNDSLNPYRTVGQTIGRTMRKLVGRSYDRQALKGHVVEHLEAVGLTAAYYDRRPGSLSGGEKQRVAIARAFAPHPALIIADEPTSSLDVSVQAVILNLLKDLRGREGASYVVISHDLEVVGYLADRIAVMYLGEIVEQGGSAHVLEPPFHPYTEALLSAAPVADPSVKRDRIKLDGDVPSPRNRPSGCPFHTRCPRKIGTICETEAPPVLTSDDGHQIRCHHPHETLLKLQKKESE